MIVLALVFKHYNRKKKIQIQAGTTVSPRVARASKCTVWAVVDVAATEYNQQKPQKQMPRTRVAQFVVCHGVHFVDHGASFFQTQAILRDLLRQTVPVRLYRCGW